MPSTFKRVNSVVVDPTQVQITDEHVDPNFPTANLAPDYGLLAPNLDTTSSNYGYSTQQASTGAAYRGQPIAVSQTSGKLVPPGTASSTTIGVLPIEISPYTLARATKVAVVRRGRVRSYAGGALTVGDPVKFDTSASFCGFVKWISGTDDASLLVGRAFPLNDDATAMVQGDTIFVDLR